MKKAIVFIVFATVFFILFLFLKSVEKNFKEKDVNMMRTDGIINNVFRTDSAATYYEITFFDGKEEKTARTVKYSHTNRKYAKGDKVKIKYPTNGSQLIYVDDSELTPAFDVLKKMCNLFLVSGIVSLVFSLIIVIRYLFF